MLLDIRMPVMDGVKAAERLSGQCKVMMLTYSDDEPMVAGAIRAGAHGYLVHGRFEPDELTRAVRDLADGKRIVSPSVAPVIFDLSRAGRAASWPAARAGPGLADRARARGHGLHRPRALQPDIAQELVISEKTVKNHIRAIYEKLGVATRAEAMAVWLGIEREERRG